MSINTHMAFTKSIYYLHNILIVKCTWGKKISCPTDHFWERAKGMDGQSGRKALGFLPRGTTAPQGHCGVSAGTQNGGDLVETSSPVPTERQPARPTAEDSSPQHPFPQPSKLESACRAQKTLLRVRFSNNT